MQALAVAIKLRGDHRKVKKDPVLKEYNNVFEQLTVSNDGLILRMHQIVIPKSLCSSLVDIAHEGHLGIVKTKQLMRFKFWFPRLDSLVEARIGNCMACQSYTPANSNNMVPLQSEPVPTSVLDTEGRSRGGGFRILLIISLEVRLVAPYGPDSWISSCIMIPNA